MIIMVTLFILIIRSWNLRARAVSMIVKSRAFGWNKRHKTDLQWRRHLRGASRPPPGSCSDLP